MNEYFSEVEKVEFRGPTSEDPLSFHYYQPDKVIGTKSMAEHLRFSVAYWHTITNEGRTNFSELETYALQSDPIELKSGHQEKLESILSHYIFGGG